MGNYRYPKCEFLPLFFGQKLSPPVPAMLEPGKVSGEQLARQRLSGQVQDQHCQILIAGSSC